MNEKQLMELLSNMPKKNKFNFSKVLMSIITGLYVIAFITSLIMFAFGVQYPVEILKAIENIFMVGFIGYCGKSGVENAIKIKNTLTNQEKYDIIKDEEKLGG